MLIWHLSDKAQILIGTYFTKPKCYFGIYFTKPKYYFDTHFYKAQILFWKKLLHYAQSPKLFPGKIYTKVPNLWEI